MLVWRKIPLISVIIVYSCVGQQNLVTTAVFAFTTVVPCLDQGPIRPSTCCFAKPPPNSLFNLEEIEAFEEQLDQPDTLRMNDHLTSTLPYKGLSFGKLLHKAKAYDLAIEWVLKYLKVRNRDAKAHCKTYISFG